MAKWDKNCSRFGFVREMIDQDEESIDFCKRILEELIKCCEDLVQDGDEEWIYHEAFIDLKSDISEYVETICEDDEYEWVESEINYFLNEFYDLCDNARVWLPA
jgi:hypothetical protein